MTKLFTNRKFLKAGIIVCTIALFAIYCINLLPFYETEFDPYSTIRSYVFRMLIMAITSVASAILVSVIYNHLLKRKKNPWMALLCVIGAYVLLYAVNSIMHYRNYAGILYAVFPLLMVLLAHYLLNENCDSLHYLLYFVAIYFFVKIYGFFIDYIWDGELTLTDVVFLAIIALIPWVTSKHIKLVWKISIPIYIILFVFLLFYERTHYIVHSLLDTLTNADESYAGYLNWIGYRLEAVKALFTGDLSFTLNYDYWNIPVSSPLLWHICNRNVVPAILYAFFTVLQIIFYFCFTIKTYKTENANPSLKLISVTLLLSNIAGIFFDLLLFSSAGFGITPVTNVCFSFILITFLVTMPEKITKYEKEPFYIGCYNKSAKKKNITVSIPLKFRRFMDDDMRWYIVEEHGTLHRFMIVSSPEVMEEMQNCDDPLCVYDEGKLETEFGKLVIPDSLFGLYTENYDVTFVGAGKHFEIWKEDDILQYSDEIDKALDITSIIDTDIISRLRVEDLLKIDFDSLPDFDEDTDVEENE